MKLRELSDQGWKVAVSTYPTELARLKAKVAFPTIDLDVKEFELESCQD